MRYLVLAKQSNEIASIPRKVVRLQPHSKANKKCVQEKRQIKFICGNLTHDKKKTVLVFAGLNRHVVSDKILTAFADIIFCSQNMHRAKKSPPCQSASA